MNYEIIHFFKQKFNTKLILFYKELAFWGKNFVKHVGLAGTVALGSTRWFELLHNSGIQYSSIT